MRGLLLLPPLVILITFWSDQAAAEDPMAAEVLFDEGVRLMKAGDFRRACGKIAESQRVEPRPGTLFTLAECWSGAGRTATALARYREYLRWYGRMSSSQKKAQRGRDEVAAKQVAKLEAVVPRLRIELAKPVPAGVVVRRNGAVVGTPALGVWLPLDPGVHMLRAAVPNGRPTIRRVELAAGARQRVTLRVAPAPAEPTAGVLKGGAPSGQAAEAPPQESGLGELMVGAVVLGAAAALALVAGVATGVAALDQAADVEAHCGIAARPGWCDGTGKARADSAQALASGSTASFVVGAAAAGAAVTLVVLDSTGGAPAGPSMTLWLGYSSHW